MESVNKVESVKSYQPVEIIEGDCSKSVVIICDHASNSIPKEYGTLGLSREILERHIAYDIGVADLTRSIASKLSLPAVLSNFSRLLIDPNRGEDDPTLVMQLSDGIVISGNAGISSEEIQLRKKNFYDPYHNAIEQVIRSVRKFETVPVLLSIHSFTPNWRGSNRVWHAGVLWDKDPRFAKLLLDSLSVDKSLIVGENEPYSGALSNDTMYKHGTLCGFPHALLEIRQDLIADDKGVEIWADKLNDVLSTVISKRMFQEVQYFGSRTEENCSESLNEAGESKQ